ncbi:hypothetical protein T439DRAFT_379039 [Meredithblackwellia eburnea MCA 4105]
MDSNMAATTTKDKFVLKLLSKRDSCLACTDPIPACPACQQGQTCIQIGRSCNQCAQNVCQGSSSSNSGSSSSKSSIGSTVGGALGGVLGILAALALIYWFWWKPKGLAASRRRYSRHLSARQSARMMSNGSAEKKSTAQAPASPTLNSPANGNGPGSATAIKRSSVHLRMENNNSDLTHRPNTPGRDDLEGPPSSTGATGGASGDRNSLDFELDNPFGDHARSSIGTSDFSFRSSHSTNIIPIAYIPPHSSSMSLDDANRGAYGEMLSHDPNHGERLIGQSSSGANGLTRGPSTSSQRAHQHPRKSVPASLASRDSLALAGADQIILNPLPPVLNPDSPIVPLSASANGAPIRPPRSPGLDLQLPKGTSTTTSPLGSPSPLGSASRPISGFPWRGAGSPPLSPTSPTLLSPTSASSSSQSQAQQQKLSAAAAAAAAGQVGSHFSTATSRASANSYLTAPGSDRGMSVLLEGQPSKVTHLSTISSSTSRSAGSTMSYILDPPQIITPVNAQGLKRVEVLGRGQAGLVRMPGSAPPATPSSVAQASIAGSSPTIGGGENPLLMRQAQDPFSDDAAAATGGSRLSTGHVRQDSESTVKDGQAGNDEDEYDEDSDEARNSARWTMSTNASRLSEAQILTVSHSIPGGLATLASTVPTPSTAAPPSTAAGGPRGSELYDSDVPTSARSSAVSVGLVDVDDRPPSSMSIGLGGHQFRPDSRASGTSFVSSRSGATDSLSMLDGIPFMQPPVPSIAGPSMGDLTIPPPSPRFPMPPPRTPSMISVGGIASPSVPTSGGGPPSPTVSLAASSYAPHSDHRGSQYSYDTSYSDGSSIAEHHQPQQHQQNLGPGAVARGSTMSLSQVVTNSINNERQQQEQLQLQQHVGEEGGRDPTSPLPEPFLPFAGQRPTSTASASGGGPGGPSSRVQSQAMSVRSGFGSGLSQIPFQLGFPSGLDSASERGSIFTVDSRSHESLGMALGQSSSSSSLSLAARYGVGRNGDEDRGGDDGGDDDDYQEGMLSGVEEQTEPGSMESRPASVQSTPSVPRERVASSGTEDTVREEAEAEAEEGREGQAQNPFADSRASTDTLALSAELSRQFEGMDE